MFDSITGSTTESVVTYNLNKIQCAACGGTGFQQRADGIYVTCPVCIGDGWRTVNRECPPCQPYVPPYSPWVPQPYYPPVIYKWDPETNVKVSVRLIPS